MHDTQISNLMYWLHSSNAQVDYVEFASQVVFELLFDEECVSSKTASEACFRIQTLFDGKSLAFESCNESADLLGNGCSYSDFKTFVDSIWYEGPYTLD